MMTLSELIKEKNKLPTGNVYAKTINGKTYYYYQYFKDGHRYSELLKNGDVKKLAPLILKRQKIEKQIKELLSKEKTIKMSLSMKRLSGHVMAGNIPVARFEDGIMFSYHESLAPLIIQRTHSIEKFLRLRMIDLTRTNARLLLKSLNIHVDEDYQTPLYAYALSVNDNYWFRPNKSKLKYGDLNFKEDNYFDTSLKGDTTVFYHKSKLTPELTTTGSYEKGWKLINKHWWLYKAGNNKEIFSELFCYEFAKLINLKTAKYEYKDGYIRSKNFAEKYNFEPLASLADDDDSYDHVFPILYEIDKNIAKDYLKMIMFDSVVYNVDRHNENIGFLRDRETGKIISLAPNFDNNIALFSTVDHLKSPQKDNFVQMFVRFLRTNKEARNLYKTIHFKNINQTMIKECIERIPIKLEESLNLEEIIYIRYEYLKNLFIK